MSVYTRYILSVLAYLCFESSLVHTYLQYIASACFVLVFVSVVKKLIERSRMLFCWWYVCRVRNLKFGTYLKFATCENNNKINELW